MVSGVAATRLKELHFTNWLNQNCESLVSLASRKVKQAQREFARCVVGICEFHHEQCFMTHVMLRLVPSQRPEQRQVQRRMDAALSLSLFLSFFLYLSLSLFSSKTHTVHTSQEGVCFPWLQQTFMDAADSASKQRCRIRRKSPNQRAVRFNVPRRNDLCLSE